MKIQDQKFNGKVYGKSGSYSIYLNNNKIEVTDEAVKEYNDFLKENEDLKHFYAGTIKVATERYAESKMHFEPTTEALKAAKLDISIEEIFIGEVKGVKMEAFLLKNSQKNEVVLKRIQVSTGKEDVNFFGEDYKEKLVSQLKSVGAL
jgi:hypothetical protein